MVSNLKKKTARLPAHVLHKVNYTKGKYLTYVFKPNSVCSVFVSPNSY